MEINPKEIFNSRLINASPEKIFSAFKEAKHLKNWWGPKGFTNTFNKFNFSKNGEWDFIMHGPDGKEYKNTIVFTEIVKPNKIVINHNCPPYFILTVSLKEENGKTRINWSQVFETVELRNNVASIVQNANEENLDRLEKEIALMRQF